MIASSYAYVFSFEELGANDTDGYQQLDRITPEPDDERMFPQTNIADRIVVRPRQLVSGSLCDKNRPRQGTPIAASREGLEGDLRISQRNQKPPELFPARAHYGLMARRDEEEPEMLTDAVNSEERGHWREAWESELTSLAKNNTWVIEHLPEGRTAIGCRWLFKRKDDSRYKARLVVKGDCQILGIDYAETFAPVPKFTTIHLLLALSCEND